MQTSQAGIDLIKEFEGFRADAYLCPAGVWTIGYGHTEGVKPGNYVSRERGEELLREDLAYFEAAVSDLIATPLSQNEFDALVSFTYNCGVGALAESTLRKRLNAGEAKCKVFQEELPKWVKAGSETLPGLVRRREAEVELACKGYTGDVGKVPGEEGYTGDVGKVPGGESHTGDVGKPSEEESYLERAAWHYASEPHQKAAWRALESLLSEDVLQAFKRAYRTPEATERPVKPEPSKFPLEVPYFWQRDSKTGHGERMCFSSSMAMALDYLDPEAIEGDDDWYLGVVLKYGDTVSSEAQVAAARSLGFDADFYTDGSLASVEALLDRGTPVPVGILHHGSVDHPTGGGHWICLIGHDETHFDVHDPFGELDLIGGGYPKAGPEDGKFQRYSKKNFKKRWCIANDSDGWYVSLG